ncbi:MAG: imelysin family protein [Pseudomonadota bacterium]
MIRFALIALLALPAFAHAEPDHTAIAERSAAAVAIPASSAFADAANALQAAAPALCDEIDPDALRARFHTAWDAWMALQHLRFGPLEEADRTLQVAFWPDSRGTTGKTVARMLKSEASVFDASGDFAASSVAGRGFHALERLLYDDQGPIALNTPYRCRYVAAVAADLDRLAAEIAQAWASTWAPLMRTAGAASNDVFLAPEEVSQRLFATLSGALEETETARLVKPLGRFDKARPRLAEAWRSGRSLRQIRLIIDAAETMMVEVFGPELSPDGLESAVRAVARAETALARVEEIGPLPEAIVESRIRVEVLQQSIAGLSQAMRQVVGPDLGLIEGFNATDGD